MALKLVGKMEQREQRRQRKALEERYATYLHGIVDELFNAAFRKGWSWPMIARASGLSYSTVLKLGNRITCYPRHMTVWKISKALGLSYTFEYPIARRKAG